MLIEKSFQILRANPALTGNVKLVVDSNYKLYLESFNANKTLRDKRFKHYLIKNYEYYKEVVQDFFSNVENSTIFDVRNIGDKSETYTDYKFQFDDTYFCGGQFVEDNFYTEEYEYSAPLYLKKDKLPTDFLIFRIDGLGSVTEDSNPSNFRERILNNLKFVSLFDLTENSDLGTWLNKNYLNDPDMPDFPMVINHDELDFSQISGLDVKLSGWNTKTLNLKEIQSNNTPIFKSEEYFTKLWEENNLIYPHILNFKFLFDDTPATPTSLRKYSINRYLGFYIDEKQELSNVSSYKGFDLNVINISDIEGLDEIETSQIPFIKDNMVVREIDGRIYSFDPIKNGWIEGNSYWIEYNKSYFLLERSINPSTDIFQVDSIIGDYLYKIISPIKIERSIDDIKSKDNLTDEDIALFSADDLKYAQRILINELGNDYTIGTTYKDRIVIDNEITFNNIVGKNIIRNSNDIYISFKRNWNDITINGITKKLYTLEIVEESNIFNIPNFEEADVYLIKIENNYHIIKKYDSTVQNLANRYYINSDWAIDVNNLEITSWINNGNISKDPLYYKFIDLQNVDTIPFFKIFRLNFTDIKDFDFDRIESNYTRYEYEKKYDIISNKEPKFYAKDYRENPLNYHTIQKDIARRIPILDENDRPLNLRDQRGEINIATGTTYTDTELYHTDLDGSSWQLFQGQKDGSDWYAYDKLFVNLNRKFYREENYIWNLEDDNNNVIGNIDFIKNSDPSNLYENLTWGANKKNEISDIKSQLPPIKSVDPNESLDTNYVPCSSEYINSDELFEIKNNDLTPILDKNQSIVKWGALNSKAVHDYSYRLNYSLDFGVYNREPNPNSIRNFPEMNEQNLNYFYRFNLLNKTNYQYYTLHLNNEFFDIDSYFNFYYDYFLTLFKTDISTSDGLDLCNKYSLFYNKNKYSESETIFRGVKYLLSDVKEVIYDEVEREKTGTLIIDDILTNPNTKYNDYKFSIIFGKKKSTFLNDYVKGNSNSNMGVDIYLNDYWKNIIIHLNINTDDTIQLFNSNINDFINAETSEIDIWYEDINDTKDENPVVWDNLEFKINNFGINLRPRDFKLLELVNYLNNRNFEPNGAINKEKINFIHIYEDKSIKVADWKTTDFILNIELPKEFSIKEKAYVVSTLNKELIPDFEINNTLENRKILQDSSNPNVNSDGLLVNSVNDINAYNNYPFTRVINNNTLDTRSYWELDENDPTIHRYDSVYVPIFKNINLFRPIMYKELRDNLKTPILKDGNWKFYDINSSNKNPDLINFGLIEELIFSKCNETSSILKIQDENDKDKSIYPMVDEWGYDYDARYIFSSNFEPSYYYISKKIEVPKNPKNKLAGYTIHYDGVSEYIRIPDHEKFNQENFIVEDSNYSNFIINKPTGERRLYNFDILNLTDNNQNYTTIFNIIKNINYKLTFTYKNIPFNSNPNINITLKFRTKNGITNTNVLLRNSSLTLLTSYPISNNQTTLELNILSSDIDSLVLSSDYINFNYYMLELKIDLISNLSNFGDTKLDISTSLEMTSSLNTNILDINTDNVYLLNNQNNQFGDNIFGSFIRKEGELNEIYYYDVFSKISNSLKFSSSELDIYDKSNLNPLGEKLWKEFAGISSNKRQGRIGVEPYIYDTYPIPKNWDGNIYLDILNRLSIGSGDSLRIFIVNVGNYGYNSYADPNSELSNDEKLSRCTLYHFLEYGSQTYQPFIILNEFYKLTGFNDFTERGFSSSFPYKNNMGIFRITNPTSFEFEPDRTTYMLDGNNITYIGNNFNTLTSSYTIFDWYQNFNDTKLILNILPVNLQGTSFNISLIDSNNDKINENDLLILMNNELTNSPYQVSLVNTVKQKSTFKIYSTLNGSYYNFNIELITLKDFIITEKHNSDLVKGYTDKFTKTSLLNNRRTGRIPDVSIEFWVRIDSWNRDWETILYKGEDNETDVWLNKDFNNFTYIIGKYSNTDKIAFKTNHESLLGEYKSHTLISNLEINDGNYHHVAFVCDLINRKKQIFIDGLLDNEVIDYLDTIDNNGNIIDTTPSTTEILARFVERRERFIQGIQNPNMGLESTLANKIRLGSQDTKTLYWIDVIKGNIVADIEDIVWQQTYWSTTIDKAYQIYLDNFKSMNYYLKVDSDTLNWDILLGTDSITTNGKRNFEGFIDELRIWNYARTEKEINTNWRYILKREAYLNPLKSLICYYRFDEGQGVNIINDLMNNYLVKDMDRWCKVRILYTNDGINEKEDEIITFYHFNNSYYTNSFISIDDTLTDWDESGAEIIGISNERSILKDPAPILTETIRQKAIPVFNRTKDTLIKRKLSKVLINTKTEILNYTIKRSFEFTPIRWWLTKTLPSRINENVQSSTIKTKIEREGSGWLNKVKKLITKKR